MLFRSASHPRAHITPSTLSPSCLRQNLRSTLDSSALVPHSPSPNLLMRHLNSLLLSPPLCSHCRSPRPGPQHPSLYRQNLLQVVPPPALPLAQHGRGPPQLRTLQWLPRGLPGTFGPRREKARRARGERRQTSGCPGRSPRREGTRSTRGEGARTAGCLARARRVLPTHSDICLQRPEIGRAHV